MPYSQVAIDSGFFATDSPAQTAQECDNLFPVMATVAGELSQGEGTLNRTPGLEETQTVGSGPGRGLYKVQSTGRLMAVSGQELFTINSPTVNTVHGVIEGLEQCIFASNGRILVIIVPGHKGYFFDLETDVLSEITDEVFLEANSVELDGVTSVDWKDGRFIYGTGDTFFLGSLQTNPDLGTGFDFLNFEDAEVSPDRILRVVVVRDELLIVGTDTVEYYQNTGDADFPYLRIRSAHLEKGAVSRNSIIPTDNSLYFLGGGEFENNAIYQVSTGRSVKISNAAIDNDLQNLSLAEQSLVRAWAYSQDGQEFVGFSFPNKTYVFSVTASQISGSPIWHTRTSDNSSWRAVNLINHFGDVYAQDKVTNQFCRVNRDIYFEYGEDIPRLFSTVYIINGTKPFRIHSLELSCTAGSGEIQRAPVGANSREDPQISLAYSLDGAREFNSMGDRPLGQAGQNRLRQIWRRIGRVDSSIVFRIQSDNMNSSDIQRMDLNLAGF